MHDTDADSANLTDVEQRHARSRARLVYLDGEPWRTTSIEAWKRLDISQGDSVSRANLSADLDEAERETCRARALRLLDARDRSRGELMARLAEDGYPQEAIGPVVDRFAEIGLVDDARLAAALVRSLAEGKGYGHHRIKRDLQRRRIDDAIVEEALASLAATDTEDERALAAAARAVRSCRDHEKLTQRLVRRGFAWDAARRAASSVLRAGSDESA